MAYHIVSNESPEGLVADVVAYQLANPTMLLIGGPFWNRYFNQALGDDGSIAPGDATSANQLLEIAQLTALNAKDYATQTTLAALLAKVIAAPSTEAKQDALNALITTLNGKDFATQTTLAAILAKIIAAPATEAKQDTGNTSLATIAGKDFATQTTLTAILAKIIASPATEATLSSILTGVLAATPAGEAHIGEVGGAQATVSASYTRPGDTNTYTSGDVICNSTSAPVILTFSNCVRINNGSGIIQSIILVDGANETLKLDADLMLFDTTVAMDNDNAPFTPTDAEMATCIGVASFYGGNFKQGLAGAGGNGVYPNAISGGISFNCIGGAKTLYGVLVARNSYIPINSEVFTIRMVILQN